MKLDVSNLKVFKDDDDNFALKIMMPDGSDNFLHSEGYSLESILIIRSLLLEQEIYEQQIEIKESSEYFRINSHIEDINDETYFFHSRILNLNDVIFERDQLIQ
jgi:hypothetical protein